VQSSKIEILPRKEKHGATFAKLEDNLVSDKMLTNARTMKSDAFLRFTVAAKADILSRPANIPQWYHQPRTNCQRCNRDLQPILSHRLDGHLANMTEMTRRHKKVVDVVRRAIEENIVEKLSSKIGDDRVIREEDLSEEVASLRRDDILMVFK
jgi:hypothetical protein